MQSARPVPEQSTVTISRAEIARLSKISEAQTGMSFGEDKSDFLLARLQDRLGAVSVASFDEYCALLEGPAGASEMHEFTEALTTNTTSFFREKGQFTWLETEGLANLLKNAPTRNGTLTVWSAASSSGQELYSVMMLASGYLQDTNTRCTLKGVGTDLSQDVVAKARQAIYSKSEISGIPETHRRRFLLSSKSQDGRYRVAPQIRQIVDFRLANLVQRNTLTEIKADIALLRNVLIYFTEAHQKLVIDNVLSNISVGGYLLTGHSETGVVRDHGLSMVRPTIYQKVR